MVMFSAPQSHHNRDHSTSYIIILMNFVTDFVFFYIVRHPLSCDVLLCFHGKFRLPIVLHSNCNLSPLAGGICQKWSTKSHDWGDDADCTFFRQGLLDGLEGAVVTGAGDAEEDWQHDESVVSGEENDEEEDLKRHGNIINDSAVQQTRTLSPTWRGSGRPLVAFPLILYKRSSLSRILPKFLKTIMYCTGI